MVLTARYHWDALASGLGTCRLGLGTCGWQGRLLLLHGLLFDYHGTLYRSAGAAADGLLIRFVRVSMGSRSVLITIKFCMIGCAQGRLGIASFLVSELACSIRRSLFVHLGPARSVGLEAAFSDEYWLLGYDVVPLFPEVLRGRMLLLGLREAGEVWATGHVGWIIRFVDDLGAAGRVALGSDVLEGQGAVSPLVLDAGQVCSVLARWLPLYESATSSCSLLVQVFAVLLGEVCRGVLLLKVASGTLLLVKAALLAHGHLEQARLVRQALVLREVIELRNGLLLSLVEFIVQFAGVHRLARRVGTDKVGDQMTLTWRHAREARERALPI